MRASLCRSRGGRSAQGNSGLAIVKTPHKKQANPYAGDEHPRARHQPITQFQACDAVLVSA